MSGEALGEEEVAGGAIDVADSSVTKGMEWVEAVEARVDLPGSEQHLYAARGEATTRECAE